MRKCLNFKDHIDACKLLDLGAIGLGSNYTWRLFERLDRAFSNDSWRLDFPDGVVRVLLRLDFSDDHPLLICLAEVPH